MIHSAKARRVTALLLCLLMVLSVAASLAETAKITGYKVRLRSRASSKSTVLDAFPKGTTVTVLGQNGSWTRVRVRGKTGYMMTRYLSISSGSGSSSGGSGSYMYVWTGTRQPLHLRSTPNTNYEPIGKYRNGTRVTVLKRGKYWTRVSVGGQEGYMWTDYLSTYRH